MTPKVLRTARVLLGIRQDHLARAYGCSSRRIRAIERSPRHLRAKTVGKYLAALAECRPDR